MLLYTHFFFIWAAAPFSSTSKQNYNSRRIAICCADVFAQDSAATYGPELSIYAQNRVQGIRRF